MRRGLRSTFGGAALFGIAALLGGGDFGETEGRILATTAIFGFVSLVVLCYLTLAGHRFAWVGAVGAVTSFVFLATALNLTWTDWSTDTEGRWQLFGVALIVTIAVAQCCLLIAVADRPPLRPWLCLTVLLAGLMAALLIPPIVFAHFPETDGYARISGVVAILDVLGTIALMAAAAILRSRPATSPFQLDPAVEARVSRIATDRRTTPDRLVSDALDLWLASPSGLRGREGQSGVGAH